MRTSQAVFYALAFFWLDGFAVPAPAQVTQTVETVEKVPFRKLIFGKWDKNIEKRLVFCVPNNILAIFEPVVGDFCEDFSSKEFFDSLVRHSAEVASGARPERMQEGESAMGKFAFGVFINHSQQDVFDFLSDPANFSNWSSAVESAEWTSSDAPGIASVYRASGKRLGSDKE